MPLYTPVGLMMLKVNPCLISLFSRGTVICRVVVTIATELEKISNLLCFIPPPIIPKRRLPPKPFQPAKTWERHAVRGASWSQVPQLLPFGPLPSYFPQPWWHQAAGSLLRAKDGQAPGDKIFWVEASEPLSCHKICNQNLRNQRRAELMGPVP